jgi:uncharacterized SAM-binding protein YcdF (DUF218 family)
MLQAFLVELKGLLTVLNGLFFMVGLALLCKKLKQPKTAKCLWVFASVFFWLTSTKYLPNYLAVQLEKKYLPLQPQALKTPPQKYYIHVLGSGNNYDDRLPATAQLGLTALSRLAEAIRIYKELPNATIVTSANSLLQKETQASVTKRAAILLGIDSSAIEKLDTPSTTTEEAADLKAKYGTNIQLIIVTDAMHMPRAITTFQAQGFKPLAAPTNFRSPLGAQSNAFAWWPATENITLMDIVLHEYLGKIKAMF